MVDCARRRRRDPADRGDGRGLVSGRFRARAGGLCARARRRVVDPRARQRWRDQRRAHELEPLVGADVAPWRRSAGLRRAGLHRDESATDALTRRTAGAEVAQRRRGSVRLARRLALRGGVHLCSGRSALAARHRDADTRARPSVRRGSRRGCSTTRGYCAVRCARRAFRARSERRGEVARRPQHRVHGARRSLACGARRATPPDERRVRRSRSNLLARRRVVGLRERAHRPVRAVAAHLARRQARTADLRSARAAPPRGTTRRQLDRLPREHEPRAESRDGLEDARLAPPRGHDNRHECGWRHGARLVGGRPRARRSSHGR